MMTTLDKWRIGIVCAGGLIVLLCSMYVSFGHSVGLVMDYDQSGESAYAIVIMLETAFLTFSISTALNKLQGKTMKWFEWIFFGVGLIYVGWSNLHAFPSTVGGVVLGISIPLYLFIMEVTLSNIIISILNKSTENGESTNVVEIMETAEMEDTKKPPLVMEDSIQSTEILENIDSTPPPPLTPMEDKPTKKKKTSTPSTKLTPPKQKCWNYIEEFVEKYGEVPKRPQLMEAGFSEWVSADTLRIYKKEKNIA